FHFLIHTKYFSDMSFGFGVSVADFGLFLSYLKTIKEWCSHDNIEEHDRLLVSSNLLKAILRSIAIVSQHSGDPSPPRELLNELEGSLNEVKELLDKHPLN